MSTIAAPRGHAPRPQRAAGIGSATALWGLSLSLLMVSSLSPILSLKTFGPGDSMWIRGRGPRTCPQRVSPLCLSARRPTLPNPEGKEKSPPLCRTAWLVGWLPGVHVGWLEQRPLELLAGQGSPETGLRRPPQLIPWTHPSEPHPGQRWPKAGGLPRRRWPPWHIGCPWADCAAAPPCCCTGGGKRLLWCDPHAGRELCPSVSGHVCRQAESWYPAADKNVQHCLSCDLFQGSGLEPLRAAVYHIEKVAVPYNCCRPWANKVHVHMGEPLLWDANLLHWCTGLSGTSCRDTCLSWSEEDFCNCWSCSHVACSEASTVQFSGPVEAGRTNTPTAGGWFTTAGSWLKHLPPRC